MIRINSIRVPLDFDFSKLEQFCIKRFKLKRAELHSIKLSRKSVDARKKNDVHFTISVDIESEEERRLLKTIKNSAIVERHIYTIPEYKGKKRPVIVGFGPAGMFAALVLAKAGAQPIILERGSDVDSRCKAVEEFRTTGNLNTECNVQFGEGGAGTFSDGKLTTGVRDPRISWVFGRFAEFGAPDEILYLAKPHIGTDKLRLVVKNLREQVISLGGEIIFNARFCGYEAENGCIKSVEYEKGGEKYSLITDKLILAAGHSARDVFELLYEKNIRLEQKIFAVGVRIEHKRETIDKALYGDFAGHPALKAADYKLAVHLPNGRTLYTFCMCPGGEVMAASSESGRLAVNGMSCFARDAENSNSALLVNIYTDDNTSDHPLAGMYLQREIEEKAFAAGGYDYRAPITRISDLLGTELPENAELVSPSYRPGTKKALPEDYLPDYVCETLRLGIPEMGKKIAGFDAPEAVITGVESRSSSPVRIIRDDTLQSPSLRGLYPCGEGAGYAGGIVTAAVDGMKCAEAVCQDK